MNTVFKSVIQFLTCLVLFNSCIKELVPSNNAYKPKPVIWAILDCDSTLSIITSGNRGIESQDFALFTNIKMFIYEGDNLVDSLISQTITSDTLTHHFKIKPRFFKFYTLKMVGSNLEISSQISTPKALQSPIEIKLSQGENAQLSYTLLDDYQLNDAYQFKIEMFHSGTLIDTSSNDTVSKNHSFLSFIEKFDEPSLNFDFLKLNPIANSDYTFPASDNLFNGRNHTFLFSIKNPASPIYFLQRNGNNLGKVDKFICKKQYVLLRCRKINTDYYLYLVSENKNNAIFGTPYFNPTNVYTNINGGLGLMASMTERIDTIWIRK